MLPLAYLLKLLITPSLAQASIQNFGVDIRKFGSQFLQTYLHDEENFIKTMSHGCWCKRISPTTKNMNMLGGSTPVDELDEICKDWFQAHVCTHHYLGGCYSQWYIDKYRYEAFIDVENRENSYCKTLDDKREDYILREHTYNGTEVKNNTNTFVPCEVDTCLIDLYYVDRIYDFWQKEPEYKIFEVYSNETCPKSKPEFLKRSCIGEAPDVKVLAETAWFKIHPDQKAFWIPSSSINEGGVVNWESGSFVLEFQIQRPRIKETGSGFGRILSIGPWEWSPGIINIDFIDGTLDFRLQISDCNFNNATDDTWLNYIHESGTIQTFLDEDNIPHRIKFVVDAIGKSVVVLIDDELIHRTYWSTFPEKCGDHGESKKQEMWVSDPGNESADVWIADLELRQMELQKPEAEEKEESEPDLL